MKNFLLFMKEAILCVGSTVIVLISIGLIAGLIANFLNNLGIWDMTVYIGETILAAIIIIFFLWFFLSGEAGK